jgi:FkbM family methyltransferase
MSISERQESIVTGMYSLARRSGFLDTALGQWLFQRAYFGYKRHMEDPYSALLARFPDLLHGGNALDIGANIGYTALVFSRAIDARSRVYAFEPDEFNFQLLQRTADSRHACGRICPRQYAVGETDGTVELWINPRHHGDHRIRTDALTVTGGTIRVPILSVDSFVARQLPPFPVRFIKVDVQGYELAVCRGMERTLAVNSGAIVALEYMPAALSELGFDPGALLHWIAQKNFHVYIIGKDGLLEPVNVNKVTTDRYLDLLLSQDPVTSSSSGAGL